VRPVSVVKAPHAAKTKRRPLDKAAVRYDKQDQGISPDNPRIN
jgi:hypothetical protein